MEPFRATLSLLLCSSLLSPASIGEAQTVVRTSSGQPSVRQSYQAGQLRGDERILHALNRFTFGPRPSDLDTVRAMGIDKWFARQLHPETIDNTELEARLAQFPAMQWSTRDLLYRLPSNAVIRQAAQGKAPIPEAGALHAIYGDEIARYEDRRKQKEQKKQQESQLASAPPMAPSDREDGLNSQSASRSVRNAQTDSNESNIAPSLSMTPDSQLFNEADTARIIALPPPQRVATLATMPQADFDNFHKSLKGPQRAALLMGLNPAQKEVVAALKGPQRVVSEELAAERLTRDIDSNAQLQEVMTDFWLNHFNVYLHKNDETPYYLVSYERDVIRPHALGKFEDLLQATAHSPAMLLYLDNSSSIGPDSPAADKAKVAAARRPDARKTAPQGLNENYARELMELHTLGVNGGYTQADVTQVARVLTGWTVDQPQRGGDFKFDESRHEPGPKKVLGKKIKEHGEQEGRELLHMLATRPATARFIAKKLAIRFVADDPPQALIERMAKSYLAHDGDIAEVLQTLFHSPEFWSQDAYRAKVKTPIEFVASAARASGASIDEMQSLLNALRDMGMPVYGAVPPTGYKWDASNWVSTGALVNRMNFALNFAANRLPGVSSAFTAPPNSTFTVEDGSGPRPAAPAIATTGNLPTPEAEELRLESESRCGRHQPPNPFRRSRSVSPAKPHRADPAATTHNAGVDKPGTGCKKPRKAGSITRRPSARLTGVSASLSKTRQETVNCEGASHADEPKILLT